MKYDPGLKRWLVLGMVWSLLPAAVICAEQTESAAEAADDQAAAEIQQVRQVRGLTVNREQGYIEFDATVVFEEGDWVELIACSPNTLEYESMLVSQIAPSNIHFGLIMLGLQPGKPLAYHMVDDKYVVSEPHGPIVEISFVLTDDKDQQQVIPVNEWIVDQETGERMPSNRWIFVGSRFAKVNDREVYLADLNGTLITLVNFSDEVIVQAQTLVTNRGGGPIYNIDPKKVPPAGTALKVRIAKTDQAVKPKGVVESRDEQPVDE